MLAKSIVGLIRSVYSLQIIACFIFTYYTAISFGKLLRKFHILSALLHMPPQVCSPEEQWAPKLEWLVLPYWAVYSPFDIRVHSDVYINNSFLIFKRRLRSWLIIQAHLTIIGLLARNDQQESFTQTRIGNHAHTHLRPPLHAFRLLCCRVSLCGARGVFWYQYRLARPLYPEPPQHGTPSNPLRAAVVNDTSYVHNYRGSQPRPRLHFVHWADVTAMTHQHNVKNSGANAWKLR